MSLLCPLGLCGTVLSEEEHVRLCFSPPVFHGLLCSQRFCPAPLHPLGAFLSVSGPLAAPSLTAALGPPCWPGEHPPLLPSPPRGCANLTWCASPAAGAQAVGSSRPSAPGYSLRAACEQTVLQKLPDHCGRRVRGSFYATFDGEGEFLQPT